MPTIPIFFTIDDKFTFYLDCAVRSIMDNASRDYCYKFIVLHENLPESHIAQIQSAVKPPFEIEFVHMEEGFAGITDRVENRLRCDFFSLSIYFRIFIADLFPEYDKGVYIDSDVILPGDISELYHTDLSGNIIAACPDFSIMNVPVLTNYVEQVVGIPKSEYINSGILVMDLKMMRDLRFSEHFLNLLNTYHFGTVAPDQDYINAMCRGKIRFLDECWDTMPPLEGERPLVKEPKLIHFNLFQKPWCYDNIAYEDYFWKYAKQSPFYQDILDFKANYSDEQKKSDQEALDRMMVQAQEMLGWDLTFEKMYESGAAIRI